MIQVYFNLYDLFECTFNNLLWWFAVLCSFLVLKYLRHILSLVYASVTFEINSRGFSRFRRAAGPATISSKEFFRSVTYMCGFFEGREGDLIGYLSTPLSNSNVLI